MQQTTINEIQEKYELEIPKIVRQIKERGAGKVLLQFPEGLKPYSCIIADYVEEKADYEVFIWLGDCFGACDVPLDVEKLGVDLIVQFGHSEWKF